MSFSDKMLAKAENIQKLVKRNGGNKFVAKTLVGLSLLTSLGAGELQAQELNHEKDSLNNKKDLKELFDLDFQKTTAKEESLAYSFGYENILKNKSGAEFVLSGKYDTNFRSQELTIHGQNKTKLNAKVGLFNFHESIIEEESAIKIDADREHGLNGIGGEISLKCDGDVYLKGGALFARGTDGRMLGFNSKDTISGEPIWYFLLEDKKFYIGGGGQGENAVNQTGFICAGAKIIDKEKNKLYIEGTSVSGLNSQLGLYAKHHFNDRFIIEAMARLGKEESSFDAVASALLGKHTTLFAKASFNDKSIKDKQILQAGIRFNTFQNHKRR